MPKKKKKIDRWKNWQPPEELWWKPIGIFDEPEERRKKRQEIETECLKDQREWSLAQSYAKHWAMKVFFRETKTKKQLIRDIADDIVGLGYYW